MYERPGYRTLLGRIRENVRTYIRKQLELPRQELAEIVRANVGAAKWFGVALAFVFAFLTALVVLIIALIALVLPLWASALIVSPVMKTTRDAVSWLRSRIRRQTLLPCMSGSRRSSAMKS